MLNVNQDAELQKDVMSFMPKWSTSGVEVGEEKTQLPNWYTSPLPKPPIPSLEHTLERYLQYASVVRHWDQVPAEDVERAVSRFFPVAEKLQEELKEIAENEHNWINRFWLETMYLRPRYPTPVNSNPAYIFPRQVFYDEDDWLLYTARVAHGMLKFKELIDKRQLTPDNSGSMRGSVPYCMDQYDRLLSLYRQPGLGCDVQLKDRYRKADAMSADQHLLVMCENQPFVLYVRRNEVCMEPAEMAAQLHEIVRKARNRGRTNVVPIGAVTAGDRESAAMFWMEMLGHEQNAASLRLIQNAVFAICLDGYIPQRLALDNPLETAGGLILHGFGQAGQGLNRWYDCTLQLVVSLDGFNGLCIEHSVAEGIVIIRMMEQVLNKVHQEHRSPTYFPTYVTNNDQHCPLSFVISSNNQRTLTRMANEFDSLATDLRLTLFNFTGFGKEFIKANKISPDGFVQMALQLAHFRQHGYLVNSYESATMRLYRYGRVDNIRAATPDTHVWVSAMFNRAVSTPQKRELFDVAAKKQALIISENVSGFGIDNHLCALENLAQKAVARGQLPKMPEIFRQQIYTELMRFPLTTSQVTPDPNFEDCYLCYGPVVADGYGCAYSIQKDQMFFAISDLKSNGRTSGIGFEAALKEALAELRYLLETTSAKL